MTTVSKWIIALLAVAALAAAAFSALHYFQPYASTWFESQRLNITGMDWLFWVFLGALASAAGLPRQAIALACGHSLGGFTGALLATLIAFLGCTLDFALGRRWIRHWLHNKYPARLLQLDGLLSESPFLKALALRLFPSGSNLLTSLLAGASSVSAGAFLAGTALGYLPQMFLFGFLGAGATWATEQRQNLSAVLLSASLALAVAVYLKHRSKN